MDDDQLTIDRLTCAGEARMAKYGIALREGVDAVQRWTSGRAPHFKYFPDFERNMLPHCIELLGRQRVRRP